MTTPPLREIVVEMGRFYADHILYLEDGGHYISMDICRPSVPMEIRGRRQSSATIPSLEFRFSPAFRESQDLRDRHETYHFPPFLEVTDDGKKLEARCYNEARFGTLADKVYPLLHKFLVDNGFTGAIHDHQFGAGDCPPVVTYTRLHHGMDIFNVTH